MALLVPLLFAPMALGPGLLLTRPLPLGALERLCAAVCGSLFASYLLAFLVYLSGLPQGFYAGIVALGALCLVVTRRDLARIWRDPSARAALQAYALLSLAGLCLLGLIRNYAGAGWTNDWIEHYQRSLFFLERRPLDQGLPPGDTPVAMRPALFSLLGTTLLGVAGAHYAVYQVTCTLLNLLVCLPCVLLAEHFGGRKPRVAFLVALLLLFSPFVVVNATYTWTKLAAAFFSLTGLAFYVRARGTRRIDDLLLSFGALSFGVLTHYSAAVYGIVLTVHFLLFELRRRAHPFRDLFLLGSVNLSILATWFAWSAHSFGWAATLAGNVPAQETSQLTFSENAARLGANLMKTLVPHPLRDVPPIFEQPNGAAELRDYWFLVFQVNLPFMLGATGWLLFLVQVARDWRSPARLFWGGFAVAAIVLGIFAPGVKDDYGLGHCIQTVPLVAIAYLGSRFATWRGWQKLLLLAGVTLNAAWTALHLYLEHMSWQLGSRAPGLSFSGWARGQYFKKHQFALEFLGDQLAGFELPLLLAIGYVVASLVLLALVLPRAAARRRLRGPLLDPP